MSCFAPLSVDCAVANAGPHSRAAPRSIAENFTFFLMYEWDSGYGCLVGQNQATVVCRPRIRRKTKAAGFRPRLRDHAPASGTSLLLGAQRAVAPGGGAGSPSIGL